MELKWGFKFLRHSIRSNALASAVKSVNEFQLKSSCFILKQIVAPIYLVEKLQQTLCSKRVL